MFTFLSEIRQNFEHNLRILANFGVKTQRSKDFAYTFSKNYSEIRQNFEHNLRILANFGVKTFFLHFLIKIILFILKIYFLQRKMPKVS